MFLAAPPPPSVPDDPPADEESFELPTLEEVARLTGTLRPQPLGRPVDILHLASLLQQELCVSMPVICGLYGKSLRPLYVLIHNSCRV